jgi:UDP-GlcNAc:undecaprenyl-phosphate/decaprenyl-phosphate GlcNAc-1-phosphate transferase
MGSYLLCFVVAAVASVVLTPLARRLALSVGALGNPGGRHVHARSIPRLGGTALAAGWGVAILTCFHLPGPGSDMLVDSGSRLWGLVLGALALCVVGAVDDIRGLRAYHKLLAQIVVAIVAYACGLRIDAISLPFLPNLAMGVFALPITVIWIVGVTNAVNLIDGLDGLAAGVGFFASLTCFVVAITAGNPFVALMTAALMGVLAGFLLFNFNPARIFMGDSGSYFIGFLLATLPIATERQQKASAAVSLLVPMLALGLPIFDTLLTMARRFLERRSVFSPDRGHIHHRLLDLGLTHRRAVVLLYGVCVVFAASAIAVSLGRIWHTGIALLSVSVVGVGLVRFAGYFEYLHLLRRQKARLYDPRAQQLRYQVPLVIAELNATRSEDEVLGLLHRAIQALDLARLEILTDGQPVLAFGMEEGEARRDTVRATYPLGRDDQARASVRFFWTGGEPDVPAQVAILLQLVVDSTMHALIRANSVLAPAPRLEPEPTYDVTHAVAAGPSGAQ